MKKVDNLNYITMGNYRRKWLLKHININNKMSLEEYTNMQTEELQNLLLLTKTYDGMWFTTSTSTNLQEWKPIVTNGIYFISNRKTNMILYADNQVLLDELQITAQLLNLTANTSSSYVLFIFLYLHILVARHLANFVKMDTVKTFVINQH